MSLEKSWEIISIAFACARRWIVWLILIFRLAPSLWTLAFTIKAISPGFSASSPALRPAFSAPTILRTKPRSRRCLDTQLAKREIFPQAVFRSLRNNSTCPSTCRRVKLLAQLEHSQKFSIALSLVIRFFVWKPKNLPPSMRISILEHCGLAHLEIMSQWRLLHS